MLPTAEKVEALPGGVLSCVFLLTSEDYDNFGRDFKSTGHSSPVRRSQPQCATDLPGCLLNCIQEGLSQPTGTKERVLLSKIATGRSGNCCFRPWASCSLGEAADLAN